MQTVLVIGAHGQTGQQLMDQLRHTRLTPIAGVRTAEQVAALTAQGVTARQIDLRTSVSALARQFTGIDAIIFSAGGGLAIDLDGKVKAAQAAERVGIRRFVLISAGGIQHFHDDDRLAWMTDYEPYATAMYYGDQYLEHSALDYTIVRPENLTNDAGTGRVRLGAYLPHTNVTRADVAALAVAALQDDRTIRRAFDVTAGKTPIATALTTFLTQE